ncbi:MAG: ATP-binding protein, partial [Myxococcota bacterium]
VDRLRGGVEALRAWLRASPASPTRRVPPLVTVFLILLGAAFAWFVHPGFSVVAGIGIGLAAIALLARPDAEARGAQKNALREFARQNLSPPAVWSDRAVDERLRDLESELALRAAAEVRADRRASEVSNLQTQREALKGDLAAIEARRHELNERLGFGLGLPDSDFVDTVRALDQRRRCARAERAAAARVAAKESRHAELLASLARYLSAHDEPEPADAASARSEVDALADRDTAYRAAQAAEESAESDLATLDREVAKLRELVDGIFREAGVEPGDRVELARRVENLDRHKDLESCRRAVALAIGSAQARLDEAGEAALALRDTDSLRSEADELARRDEELVSLQQEIQEIRGEVRRAREGNDLEELHAERSEALEALREKRDEALLARAGRFLIEMVRDEHETTQAPRVLERARELFGHFTHHAYQLVVPSDHAASFRAIDADTSESKRPDELSHGTRAQLLLAVRLAFAEEAEQGTPLPVFLDEALDPSDPVRFDAIVRSLGRMAAEGDRQFIYLTADPADVTRIQAALEAEGCGAARVIDLAEVRKRSAAVAHADDLLVPPLPAIPAPGGRSAEEYGAALGIPAFDPRRGHAAQHLFHLVWDDLDLLHWLLERRIQHVGQWRMASAAGSAIALQPESAGPTGRQLAARVDLLDDFCRLWSEGRGRAVDRDVLDASGAVTATFFERVVEVATELDGDANALIEAMRSRLDERLSGYRSHATDKLEAFLVDEGHIDLRPVLDEDEICARVMASPAAARLPGDLAAECVHRWWTLCHP